MTEPGQPLRIAERERIPTPRTEISIRTSGPRTSFLAKNPFTWARKRLQGLRPSRAGYTQIEDIGAEETAFDRRQLLQNEERIPLNPRSRLAEHAEMTERLTINDRNIYNPRTNQWGTEHHFEEEELPLVRMEESTNIFGDRIQQAFLHTTRTQRIKHRIQTFNKGLRTKLRNIQRTGLSIEAKTGLITTGLITAIISIEEIARRANMSPEEQKAEEAVQIKDWNEYVKEKKVVQNKMINRQNMWRIATNQLRTNLQRWYGSKYNEDWFQRALTIAKGAKGPREIAEADLHKVFDDALKAYTEIDNEQGALHELEMKDRENAFQTMKKHFDALWDAWQAYRETNRLKRIDNQLHKAQEMLQHAMDHKEIDIAAFYLEEIAELKAGADPDGMSALTVEQMEGILKMVDNAKDENDIKTIQETIAENVNANLTMLANHEHAEGDLTTDTVDEITDQIDEHTPEEIEKMIKDLDSGTIVHPHVETKEDQWRHKIDKLLQSLEDALDQSERNTILREIEALRRKMRENMDTVPILTLYTPILIPPTRAGPPPTHFPPMPDPRRGGDDGRPLPEQIANPLPTPPPTDDPGMQLPQRPPRRQYNPGKINPWDWLARATYEQGAPYKQRKKVKPKQYFAGIINYGHVKVTVCQNEEIPVSETVVHKQQTTTYSTYRMKPPQRINVLGPRSTNTMTVKKFTKFTHQNSSHQPLSRQ